LEDMAGVQVNTARNRAARWHGSPYPVTIRYVDVGEAQRGTILLMHGIPTWGYLCKPDGQPPRPFTSQSPHVLSFAPSNAAVVMLVEGLKRSQIVDNIKTLWQRRERQEESFNRPLLTPFNSSAIRQVREKF